MKLVVKIIILAIYIYFGWLIATKRDHGLTWTQIFIELIEDVYRILIDSLPVLIFVGGIVLILIS